MGESKRRRICLGLVVAATILVTSCEGAEEEEEEEEASMPAWCNVGNSHYNRGARACQDGVMHECRANGEWVKTETACNSASSSTPSSSK